MYTPNVYDTINSDLYIQNNKVLKNDGTLQSFDDFYVINKIPVSAGDNLLFSLNLIDAVQSSYAAYCFMDSNSVVYDYSYAEAIIEDKTVTVKKDGFFSCCCRRKPFNMFADIIQD